MKTSTLLLFLLVGSQTVLAQGAESENSNVQNIVLSGFTATQDVTTILISWNTSSENGNDYFTVERTSDGINYVVVATAEGAGNSSEQKNYTLTDSFPYPGLNYYRLKQTDFNGSVELLAIYSVDYTPPVEVFSMYPNPCTGNQLHVTVQEEGSQSIQIAGINGQVYYTNTIVASGPTAFEIELPLLAPGIYFVSVTGLTVQQRQQLIIQ